MAHDVLRSDNEVVFAYCDWPSPSYRAQDSYTEIRIVTVDGPGEFEASDASLADRVTAPCQQLELSYTFGLQGAVEYLSPFTVSPGTVTSQDAPGEPWDGELPFSPERGEVVYVHNAHQSLDHARCIS
jgi:hypothetical protein